MRIKKTIYLNGKKKKLIKKSGTCEKRDSKKKN
jgi:hypothetical protein